MNAEELFVDSLPLIERIVASVARRSSLAESEIGDFASSVHLGLIEDDYAVLRKFQGRSSIATYLTAVIHRMLLDYRIAAWGKWHPSAAARRLGPAAIDLERLLHRDGRTMEEATPILVHRDPTLTPEIVQSLAFALPPRSPKRRLVAIEDAEAVATAEPEPGHHQTETSTRISELVTEFLEAAPETDRLMLQLRFEGGMTVAEIARSLHLDQRQLYRSMERHFRELRVLLEKHGISHSDAAELIGDQRAHLDFRFGNPGARPSNDAEALTNGPEELSR